MKPTCRFVIKLTHPDAKQFYGHMGSLLDYNPNTDDFHSPYLDRVSYDPKTKTLGFVVVEDLSDITDSIRKIFDPTGILICMLHKGRISGNEYIVMNWIYELYSNITNDIIECKNMKAYLNKLIKNAEASYLEGIDRTYGYMRSNDSGTCAIHAYVECVE